MIWREAIDHGTDCYFCVSKITGIGKCRTIEYADVKSVTKPVPHAADPTFHNRESNESHKTTKSSASEYEPGKKHLLTQAELNDWIRDLELSKEKAELHASRMQQYGFLAPDVKITFYRNRHVPFAQHYTKVGNICY